MAHIIGGASSDSLILSNSLDNKHSFESSALDDVTIAIKRGRDEDSSNNESRKKPRIHELTWAQSRPPKPPESARDKHHHKI